MDTVHPPDGSGHPTPAPRRILIRLAYLGTMPYAHPCGCPPEGHRTCLICSDLLYRDVHWFRDGLEFQAHGLVCHSTLGVGATKGKETTVKDDGVPQAM